MPYDGPPVSSGYPDHNPDAGILEGTVINLCDQVAGFIDDILEVRQQLGIALNFLCLEM